MPSTNDLTDLEDLAAHTTEPARGLFREALACWRAGALRASLALAWSAVVADILGKLQHLDSSGPQPIRTRIAGNPSLGVLRSRGHSDPVDAYHLESALLGAAEHDFDLLSPAERHELTRLNRDRHYSLHPSMLPLAEPFAPSPELVQAHLRAVADHLLRRSALQGVHALDALWLELDSEHFPRDGAAAEAYLRASPLQTARPGTIRGAVLELLRRVLEDLRPLGERARHLAALGALMRIHEAATLSALSAALTPTITHLGDTHLGNVVALLAAITRAWDLLGPPARSKVTSFVAELQGPTLIDVLHDALAVPELLSTAQRRIKGLGPRLLLTLIERGDRVACCGRAVELVCASDDFAEGERLASALLPPVMRALTPELAVKLIGDIADRDHLFQSWRIIGDVLPNGFDDLRRHSEAMVGVWTRLYRRTLRDLVPERSARLRGQIASLYPELFAAA